MSGLLVGFASGAFWAVLLLSLHDNWSFRGVLWTMTGSCEVLEISGECATKQFVLPYRWKCNRNPQERAT